MAKNKIITSEGNVQFQLGDGSGKIINVHPFHIYSVFNEDTVSFILIAMPKSSGLAIFTSKAEDLEVNGTTYTFAELPDALAEAFAVAGAQARAEIVDELPETGQTNTIYLVPKEDGQGFDEYIYVDGQWELLGDTDIELDRYVEKTDFSAYTASTQSLIDTISGDVATVSGQVASEVTRATGAEGALDTKIDTVSGDVITEASRAESAETTLDGKIDGKVLEVTQAEYDALVSGGTLDPLVLYIITDATPVNMNEYYKKTEVESMIDAAVSGKADADSVYTKSEVYTKAEVDEAIDDIDLSNYYTKSETSGATEIQNALDGKANSGDIKTFVAGRGISITTGETADTIAFNLPVYLSGSSAVSVGQPIGRTMYDNKVSGFSATAIGAGLNSLNSYETATGVHNIQRTNSNAFGNSGSTLFTIGNGAGDGSKYRHNALEVRQNGDIYIPDTNDTSHSEFYKKPMIKLQDALGQGGGGTVESAITSGSTNAVESKAIWSATTYNKEVTLEFDNSSMHYSTNFPSGCTTVKVTVPNGTGYINVHFCSGSTNYTVGSATIQKYGSTPNVSMNFTDASYTIENNDVIITYPASKSVDKVRADNNLEGAIVKAVVEGAFVNENTYMSVEVDGKIKALDDKKLDATAYTPTVVDSQLNAASTNPVQNQALYDELVIEGAESETTLTFSNVGDSTNYPNGCTKLNVEVVGSNNASTINFYNDNQNLGNINIPNFGSIVVDNHFNGASYEISGTTVIITYPTVIVTKINVGGTGNYVYKAIAVSATPLKDQVVAIQDSLSGYVTTDTEQIISGRKIFTYSASSSKAIEFKQTDDSAKVGFRVRTSAATNNELASFEFRPNTFTINGVQHPLLYFGHYRNNNTASGGIEQTVIGFRQYDQPHSAAYHYLLPLPERAKFPFSLTTSFKDYYAPMGYKVNTGGTIVTTDDTGIVDLSSYIGGGGSTYTAGDGIDITSDVISVTGKVDTDDFNTYSGSVESRLAEDEEVTAAALNALNDAFGGMKLVKLTQTQYDNLSTKDSNTLYVIVN